MEVSVSLKKALDPEVARTLVTRLRQSTRTASEVMTAEPTTIGAQAYLSEAARLMAKRSLKRLPVVDGNNHLVGVVSRLDILKVLAAGYLPQGATSEPPPLRSYGARTVADVMDPNVPTVAPHTLLSEVLAYLSGTRVKRAVVVTSEQRVEGIISDTDLFARMNAETHPGILEQLVSRLPLGQRSAEARSHLQKARGKTAADLMTCPAITLRADESIGTALAISAEKHIKRFPVVDRDGKLVGIVGRAELLSALVNTLAPGETGRHCWGTLGSGISRDQHRWHTRRHCPLLNDQLGGSTTRSKFSVRDLYYQHQRRLCSGPVYGFPARSRLRARSLPAIFRYRFLRRIHDIFHLDLRVASTLSRRQRPAGIYQFIGESHHRHVRSVSWVRSRKDGLAPRSDR